MMNNKLWKFSKEKTCLFFQSEVQKGWKVDGELSCVKFTFLILFPDVCDDISSRSVQRKKTIYV